MNSTEPSRRIHVLREAEVRKIAAGEVIDRPLSVVRELLDNSIDSNAGEIAVYVDGGGVERIRVVDNGIGMAPADLEICILPHATSKISTTEDIYTAETLGFRGEALSSIAACSKLEITSTSRENRAEGRRITVHAGKLIASSPAPATEGTTVEVSDLFYSLPGRRKFLKRVSSESQACKQAFIEKALPFPNIAFRYFADGDLKLYLPAGSLTERVSAVFSRSLTPELLDIGELSADGVSLKAVLTKPGFSRRDRRLVHVYVNGRRIQEYALIQAVSYGYSQHLPGGNYPAAFLFIDVDPQLVDFNIHPAKREVRFKNLQTIHRGTVDLVRSILSAHKVRPEESYRSNYRQESIIQDMPARYTPAFEKPHRAESIDINSLRADFKPSDRVLPHPSIEGLKYHGQIFGLFLLAEYGDSLYIIDQHAAHERILYEKLSKGTGEVQNLLVPISLDLEEDEEAILSRDLKSFENLGFSIKKDETGVWSITACPAVCFDMKEELPAFIKGRKGDSTSLQQELYATISCRAAVMDGEILDDLSGQELAAKALNLDNARCPHGRPIWFKISREELFKLVERI